MVAAATTLTSAGVVVHELDYSDPEAVVDDWTPERMQSAHPAELLRAPAPSRIAPLGHLQSRAVTGFISPGKVAFRPHTSIGKVFFTLRGFDFVCSASAVTSQGRWGAGSRNLIVTAGHCLNDGAGEFATELIFVPGYFDGNAPFGRWLAETMFTTSAWNSGFGLAFSRDVAFAQLRAGTPQHEGSDLHDVVDPLGIIFTEPYPEDGLTNGVSPMEGSEYASIGYGLQNWGGENQVRSLGSVVALDLNFFPNPIALPSEHTGGSSGGPWLYRYGPTRKYEGRGANLVNSVNSYKYHGVDRIHGPQFDDQIHSLWMFAATW